MGGLFWFLALIARIFPLLILSSIIKIQLYLILVFCLFAGIFETLFRILMLYYFTKYTANSREKIFMAGFGWGTIEAILIYVIPILFLFFLKPDKNIIHSLEGYEFLILLGGYERILTEFFHLSLLIIIFYGIRENLKDIEISKRITRNIFTRDPKPKWIWVPIVIALHFIYDFFSIILLYVFGFFITYLFLSLLVFLLMIYVRYRIKYYPLFPDTQQN